MHTDLLYQLALCDVPNIGNVQAKMLCEHFGSAYDVFRASHSLLEGIDGIGEIRARCIKNFRSFYKAEREIAFIEKYNIQPLHFTDKNYPKRLLNCYDPPVLLFYKGTADLNVSRIISIIGTRRNSEYGKMVTERIIADLAEYNALIVSGLAFGIDTIAHKSAIKNGLATVGVVGHGLDMLYPPENAALAKEMLNQGGLLTEYRSKTKPDKHNFPTRNRIVAGISEATVIIETDTRGGSMITANTAVDYHKDVFAVPGRINDNRSGGCNALIRDNKAALLQSGRQLAEMLGWTEVRVKKPRQPELFAELDANEQAIASFIRDKEKVALDELNIHSGLSLSHLTTVLLNLELKNIIQCLPGRVYSPAS